jgi:hypothetical protein
MNITVISNSKPSIIDRIKRACKIRQKITRLDKLEEYEPERIVGHATKLDFKTF